MAILQRFYPVAAFLGGFVWDALTLGQRVRGIDLWRLGGYLWCAALLALWLARRASHRCMAPPKTAGWRGYVAMAGWHAPYLLTQFFFGGIFSALFILYFKSSGHLGTWMMAGFLGGLLVANEFAGDRYGRRFTLTWVLFAFNATLLFNFALPHLVGSLNPLWFYLSTGAGILLAQGLWWVAPGRPGRIWPAWGVPILLLLAWNLGMVAPVPLVKRGMAVGHQFVQETGRFALSVEQAPRWQFWRDQASIVRVTKGERLYGVSAVFAPRGVSANLEHRWEIKENGRWRQVYRNQFQSQGGREGGFRGYSWISNPRPGDWQFVLATQEGQTIGILSLSVERGTPQAGEMRVQQF